LIQTEDSAARRSELRSVPIARMISTRNLVSAQQTLLMPLWARAMESKHRSPILRDKKAVDICRDLDFEFAEFESRNVDSVGYCVRASLIDTLVREFIDENPDGSVVEFGPGLDSRYERVANESVQWYEIELPEAASLRQRFFEHSNRRRLISGSIIDPDWREIVSAAGHSKLMFVAEGVFYFLSRQELARLFSSLADVFPGSCIVFDAQSPLYLWYCNRRHPLRGSRLLWSMRRGEEVEGWDSRMKLTRYIGFGDRPHYGDHMNRFPWTTRLARLVCPPIRHFFKICQVQLGDRRTAA
jgi:O-methyltransferase involved in polyketide biosynthesis